MLRVLPPTFKSVNNLISCKTGSMWVAKLTQHRYSTCSVAILQYNMILKYGRLAEWGRLLTKTRSRGGGGGFNRNKAVIGKRALLASHNDGNHGFGGHLDG